MGRPVPRALSLTNVALRALLETGIVATFAYWGFSATSNTPVRLVLAVITPVVAFGFWGAVDFRFAGRYAEPLRLVQELAVTILASTALYRTHHHLLAWLLLALSAIHHTAVYLLGERLLKRQTAEPPPEQART